MNIFRHVGLFAYHQYTGVVLRQPTEDGSASTTARVGGEVICLQGSVGYETVTV